MMALVDLSPPADGASGHWKSPRMEDNAALVDHESFHVMPYFPAKVFCSSMYHLVL